MASKAPEFNQMMSSPDFKGKVTEPIVTRTGGLGFETAMGSVKALGEAGLEAYKGYNISSLEKQTKAEIDDYLSKSPTRIKEVELEAAGLEQTLKQFPMSEAGDGASVDAAISGVQKELDSKLDFLRKAKDQGIMTPEMFTERVLKNTREAVARNPGIGRDLMSSAQQVLELSGIQNRITQDKALAKSAADSMSKMQMDIWNEADKRNIPVRYNSNGSVDYDLMLGDIQKNRAQLGSYELLKRNHEIGDIQSKEDVKMFTDKGMHYGAVNGAFGTLEEKLIALFNDTTTPYPNKVATAKSMADQASAEIRTYFAPYMNDAEIKSAAEFFDKRVTTLVTNMDNFKSGKDLKDYLVNQKSIMEETQNIELLKRVNMAEFKFISSVVKDAGFANLNQSADGRKLTNAFVTLSQDILRGAPIVASSYDKNPLIKDSIATTTLKSAISGVSDNTPESISTMNKAIKSYVDGINNPETTPTLNDFYTRAGDLVKVLKDPINASNLSKLDEVSRGQLTEIMNTYNDQTALSMGTYLRTHPNENITLSVQPNGTLVATGASEAFNRDIVGRINSNLSAYANLNGVSTKEASKSFYAEHYRDVLTTPDNTSTKAKVSNNPLNLKDASAKGVRQFDTLEEGINASASQLTRYFEGKGVAGGKPRKTVTDIIDLWRPASDRKGEGDIAQKEYIDFVSKTIGVSPRQELNLNDKVVMSKLIAAMSTVEGNPLDSDRVFKALPKDVTKMPASDRIKAGAEFSDLTFGQQLTGANPASLALSNKPPKKGQ